MLDNSLEFVLCKKSNTLALNFNFVLLPIKVDLVSKKQSCKEDAYVACSFDCVKIVLILSKKVIAFYVQASIVKVVISGFEKTIASYVIYLKLAMFLIFNKLFWS